MDAYERWVHDDDIDDHDEELSWVGWLRGCLSLSRYGRHAVTVASSSTVQGHVDPTELRSATDTFPVRKGR